MKPEAQQIAIAEACGWTEIKERRNVSVDFDSRSVTTIEGLMGYPQNWDSLQFLPDYIDDLNAMAEAESSIPQPSDFYRFNLIEVCGSEQRIHLATAAQRAEALLRTLNLWTDE